nr:hypothetical protein BaRGS_013395 [Batillaria attramentaria]
MASMENANDTYENVHVDPGPRPQSKSERKISLVIKFILFFFNVCMLLLGLLVTALGAWQLFEKHLVTEDRLRRLSGVINVLAAINIITGILIVSLSCAGSFFCVAMCCGVTDAGYMDWNLNKYYNCSNDISSPLQCSVPFSCCLRPDTVEVGTGPTDTTDD